MSNGASKNIVKIMVFGTFDGVHRGHVNFFKQAKRLVKRAGGKKSFLIASVARDANVKRIKKIFPRLKEKQRLLLLKKNKLIDKVVLGGAKNHVPHIVRERPDIIALGYDQHEYIKNLKRDLKAKGLHVKIVRLKAYKTHIYKNRLLKRRKI